MEAGQPYDAFWRLTVREIVVILAGVASRRRREHNERAWLAWHIAALPRVKKMPPLKKLQTDGRPRRRQTTDEMIAIAQQWTAVVSSPRAPG